MEEKAFGRVAVEKGFITQRKLDEVLVIMKKLEELGIPEKMGAVMAKKGYLTEDQVRDIVAQQGQDKRSVIPGYEIVEKLGQGAFGAVYKARQVSLDRLVAVKILPPSLAKNQKFIARFMREARAVAKLSHPNIVQGIDVNQAGGYYYLVMEYIDGETVTEILKREGRLDERRALDIVKQVASALVHADKHNMVHRDIKPDNIMVAKDRTAKLCDLGLARSTSGEDMLTRPGGTIGTPHYISPEQARGLSDIDTRADIYSLGASLYHMITGRTPFEGKSAAVVMTKHLTEEFPSPQDLVETLSDGVCHVVEKCMAKDRDDRYQKPAELIGDIERILRKEAPVSPRLAAGKSAIMRAVRRAELKRKVTKDTAAAPPAKTRGAGVWVIGAVCTVLACAIVAALMWPVGKKKKDRKDRPKPHLAVRPPAESPAPAEPEGEKGKGQALLEETLEYAKANPDDYAGILSRLEKVVGQTGGVVRLRAEDELRTWRTRRNAALREALAEAGKKARELCGRHRFGDALRAFDSVPRKLAEGTDAVRRERESILRLAREKLGEFSAEARKACAAGDLKGARKIAGRLKAFGVKEAEDERKRLIAVIEGAEKKAAAGLAREKAKKAREEHASIVSRSMELARARGFAEAEKACRAAVSKKELSQWRNEFERLRSDFALCVRLEERAFQGLEAAKRTGASVQVHKGKEGFKVKVVSVAGRDFYVKRAGAELKLSLDDLTPFDILRLAGLRLSKPQDRYGYALLLYFEGETARARDQFEKAAKDASLKPACDYYLRKITGAETDAREEEAAELLRKAREEHKAGDKSLARTLAKLDSYKDTAVYRRNYAPAAPPVPKPLRTEKFPMKADNRIWRISDGKWSFSGNEMAGSSLGGALRTSWGWEEYVLEGEWLAEKGTKEVIFIARTTSNTWKDAAVCVAVGPSMAEVRRYKLRAATLAKEAVSLPNGQWRRFRLDVRGGMVAFYMGGKTVVRARWLPGPRGMVGFAVQGKARFRNLTVHILREQRGKKR